MATTIADLYVHAFIINRIGWTKQTYVNTARTLDAMRRFSREDAAFQVKLANDTPNISVVERTAARINHVINAPELGCSYYVY